MYLYLELCLHHWTQNQNIRAKRFLNFFCEPNWTFGNFLVQAMGPSVGICTPASFTICLDSAVPFLMGLVTITAVPWWLSMPFTSSMRDNEQLHSYDSMSKSCITHKWRTSTWEAFSGWLKRCFQQQRKNDLAGTTSPYQLLGMQKFLGSEWKFLYSFKYEIV